VLPTTSVSRLAHKRCQFKVMKDVVFSLCHQVVKRCVYPCCLVRDAVFVSFSRLAVIRAGTEARAL
jgi:hypothetical protein